MQLFDETTSLLVRVLDLREARQQLITANIANEETPGYRARDLVFTEALAAALRGQPGANVRATHVPHFGVPGDSLSHVRGRIVELPAGELPLDGNSVNLELEMAKLADNAGKFSGVAQVLGIRFRQLLHAIRTIE